jgi:hypothetical protein
MKRIPLIKRKSFLNAGIPNSHLILLSQRNAYFKDRHGDKAIFGNGDALLVFIASELFDFLPFRNVSAVIDDLVKSHPNLYRLLSQNPKQFLIIEKKAFLPELNLEEYVAFPVLAESLKVLDWENRTAMVLLNLEKIFDRIENLFQTEGLVTD